MGKVKTGIVLVGFGGPRSLGEVAPLLERVMGFAPPPPVLASAKAKYELIGGKSPLVEIAQQICLKLKAALSESKLSGHIKHIESGMCYTEPFTCEALKCLEEAGCEQIIYLSMTPFESFTAWQEPYERCHDEFAGEIIKAPTFGLEPAYLQAHTESIANALKGAGEAELVFVAHSLPLDGGREIAVHYEQQLLQACNSISSKLDIDYSLSYVSLGARGGRWLEPKLADKLKVLAEKGCKSVIVCPLGFATDHMEVLYDLDIAAAKEATSLGINFTRTPTLATTDAINPALIEAMVGSVELALQEGSKLS